MQIVRVFICGYYFSLSRTHTHICSLALLPYLSALFPSDHVRRSQWETGPLLLPLVIPEPSLIILAACRLWLEHHRSQRHKSGVCRLQMRREKISFKILLRKLVRKDCLAVERVQVACLYSRSCYALCYDYFAYPQDRTIPKKACSRESRSRIGGERVRVAVRDLIGPVSSESDIVWLANYLCGYVQAR